MAFSNWVVDGMKFWRDLTNDGAIMARFLKSRQNSRYPWRSSCSPAQQPQAQDGSGGSADGNTG